MTTEEMMELYKNAWNKERENSNRLCVLKDEAIEKMNRLQEQIKEANDVIKHYANDENWCDYYDDDDEKMTKSLYINCDGPLTAKVYLKKWGVK